MLASLRKVLIDSHAAAIAIAALLAGSVLVLFSALVAPASFILSSLIVAVATQDIPYVPRALVRASPYLRVENLVFSLSIAASNLACAYLLSFWVYGKGPLRSLGNYRERLLRKKDV